MECPVKIEFKFNDVILMKNILTSQEYIHKWQFAMTSGLYKTGTDGTAGTRTLVQKSDIEIFLYYFSNKYLTYWKGNYRYRTNVIFSNWRPWRCEYLYLYF